MTSDTSARPTALAQASLSRGWVAVGLLIYALAGALTGLFEVLFVPLRSGSTMIPISVLLALASNTVLPRLSRQIRRDNLGAMAPVAGGIAVVFVLALGRPEGDVILAGGSGGDAVVGYLLMVAGFGAGLFSVLRSASVALSVDRQSRRNQAPGARRY